VIITDLAHAKVKISVKVLSETDAESRMRHTVSLGKTLRIRAASDLPEHKLMCSWVKKPRRSFYLKSPDQSLHTLSQME